MFHPQDVFPNKLEAACFIPNRVKSKNRFKKAISHLSTPALWNINSIIHTVDSYISDLPWLTQFIVQCVSYLLLCWIRTTYYRSCGGVDGLSQAIKWLVVMNCQRLNTIVLKMNPKYYNTCQCNVVIQHIVSYMYLELSRNYPLSLTNRHPPRVLRHIESAEWQMCITMITKIPLP